MQARSKTLVEVFPERLECGSCKLVDNWSEIDIQLCTGYLLTFIAVNACWWETTALVVLHLQQLCSHVIIWAELATLWELCHKYCAPSLLTVLGLPIYICCCTTKYNSQLLYFVPCKWFCSPNKTCLNAYLGSWLYVRSDSVIAGLHWYLPCGIWLITLPYTVSWHLLVQTLFFLWVFGLALYKRSTFPARSILAFY